MNYEKILAKKLNFLMFFFCFVFSSYLKLLVDVMTTAYYANNMGVKWTRKLIYGILPVDRAISMQSIQLLRDLYQV